MTGPAPGGSADRQVEVLLVGALAVRPLERAGELRNRGEVSFKWIVNAFAVRVSPFRDGATLLLATAAALRESPTRSDALHRCGADCTGGAWCLDLRGEEREAREPGAVPPGKRDQPGPERGSRSRRLE
jgi:hypothetical protein